MYYEWRKSNILRRQHKQYNSGHHPQSPDPRTSPVCSSSLSLEVEDWRSFTLRQVLQRIDGDVVQMHFVMQVGPGGKDQTCSRSGRSAGSAGVAD